MHVLGGFTSGTQWTLSLVSCISFILDPWSWCADLWTTMGSGHSMPSSHPSGTWLMRCWVRHPSTLSFGKSFSHSNGVDSASADWVDTLLSVSSLSHKGVTSPWGLANKKSQLQWVTFTLLRVFDLIQGHTICDLAYYLIFHFAPPVFHLPFPLKCISFLQHYVFQHQLNCASSFIIIALLSVHFAAGLVLGFGISFFEVLSHLFHIGGDSTVTCISTNCGEEKSMRRWGHLPNMR